MTERHELLNVDSIDFDTENPRIKKALERYGGKLSAERTHFALRSASPENGSPFLAVVPATESRFA